MRRRELERLAGRPVDYDRMRDTPCSGVYDAHFYAVACKVFVAPRKQRKQHRAKVEPFARQYVFIARRAVAVRATLQYSGIYQRAEAPREHIRGDAEALLELLEAGQSVQRVANDQHVPPFADVLKAAPDGAMSAFEALVTQ